MAKESWYKKGTDGRKESKKADEEAKQRRAQSFNRFWLEQDSSGKITYLDNPDFFVYEHNLKLGGKWFNYFTCLKDMDTCPLCESGDNPSLAVVCTIVDHRRYEDKEGNVHQNEKKLFVARGKARQILLKRLEEKHDGDMVGCVYNMGRGAHKNESSVGEDFDFLKKLEKKDLKKMVPKGQDEDWLKPFDYEELLAPKSADELRKLVGAPSPVGSEEEVDEKPEKQESVEEELDNDEVTSIEDLL